MNVKASKKNYRLSNVSLPQDVRLEPDSPEKTIAGPSADIEPTTKTAPSKEDEPVKREPDQKQPSNK